MNSPSPLSSLVCIVSACLAGAAPAQTPPAAPADAPVSASSTLSAPPVLQRSAQTAAPGAAAESDTPASDVAAPGFAFPLAATRAAAQPESRPRSALRRPLVANRPHRPQAASAPATDAWSADTLYSSPYAKSPYEQPGPPD
ncbi:MULTISPECIES: hypothetical protein [Burkholderia]|uniref:Lipoprotein n=1 Tax=Burkholderia anthina TaxID=179879 RepID=A0A7T6VI56_9BURK|nr:MULTISPECIES: hypothetical protein [Burkholderia]QQK04390.1 hypothetical protein JFN94_23800 [Burkholderia anthina]